MEKKISTATIDVRKLLGMDGNGQSLWGVRSPAGGTKPVGISKPAGDTKPTFR